jgi:hypothetical protein
MCRPDDILVGVVMGRARKAGGSGESVIFDGAVGTDESGRRSWRDDDCRGLSIILNGKAGSGVWLDARAVQDGDAVPLRLHLSRLERLAWRAEDDVQAFYGDVPAPRRWAAS